MIRQRVIEQLRAQQWVAVFIELAIVVLGVFIGLQVSNWNQDRESARQGANFAERLKSDLRHEDWVYQLMIDYNRQVLKSAMEAVSALEGKTAAVGRGAAGERLPRHAIQAAGPPPRDIR